MESKIFPRYGFFIKKESTVYLVKNIKQQAKGYLLEFSCCLSNRNSGKLHIDGRKLFYDYEMNRIKLPSEDEKENLISKIKDYENISLL
jgi:hypothetical protein